MIHIFQPLSPVLVLDDEPIMQVRNIEHEQDKNNEENFECVVSFPHNFHLNKSYMI